MNPPFKKKKKRSAFLPFLRVPKSENEERSMCLHAGPPAPQKKKAFVKDFALHVSSSAS